MLDTVKTKIEESKSAIKGLHFDGRKDDTLVLMKTGKRTYQSKVREEYVVLVEEPEFPLFRVCLPAGVSAKVIKPAILDFFAKEKVDTPNTKGYGGTK